MALKDLALDPDAPRGPEAAARAARPTRRPEPKPVKKAKRKARKARGEWPQFNGPKRDGKSAETRLLKTWPEGGPERLWTFDGCGVGSDDDDSSGHV